MKIDIERLIIGDRRILSGDGRGKTTALRTVIIERRRARRLSIRTGEAR